MWLNLSRVIAGGRCGVGVVGRDRVETTVSAMLCCGVSGRFLERVAVVGESPVRENIMHGMDCVSPSSSELVEFAVNLPGPPGKPKYSLMTDSGLVP
jgi:hypothetical protein